MAMLGGLGLDSILQPKLQVLLVPFELDCILNSVILSSVFPVCMTVYQYFTLGRVGSVAICPCEGTQLLQQLLLSDEVSQYIHASFQCTLHVHSNEVVYIHHT